MRRILVIDNWHKVDGGASKSALYEELFKLYDLKIIKVKMPTILKFLSYVKTFHPNINTWKKRKGHFDETVSKRPKTFQLMTKAYSQAIQKVKEPYDAILQIGSLFGPVENPKGVPYFSYSDSTVRNPDKMWSDWMPDDFDQIRDKWHKLEKHYFESLTGSMFYSQWAAETLTKDYEIPPSKTYIVGSALKMPGEHAIDWSKRKNQVVFVSTDFKRKGGYQLPEIFKKVASAIPDAKLIVAGNVPQDFDCNESWIELKGAVSKEDLIKIYKQSRILLHPAKYDPFPSIIFEAANFEIPAVASLICGIPEMIKDTQTGYLAERNDYDTFAQCIIHLLKDDEHCMALGKEAKNYVKEKFHPTQIAKNIQSVLEGAND